MFRKSLRHSTHFFNSRQSVQVSSAFLHTSFSLKKNQKHEITPLPAKSRFTSHPVHGIFKRRPAVLSRHTIDTPLLTPKTSVMFLQHKRNLSGIDILLITINIAGSVWSLFRVRQQEKIFKQTENLLRDMKNENTLLKTDIAKYIPAIQVMTKVFYVSDQIKGAQLLCSLNEVALKNKSIQLLLAVFARMIEQGKVAIFSLNEIQENIVFADELTTKAYYRCSRGEIVIRSGCGIDSLIHEITHAVSYEINLSLSSINPVLHDLKYSCEQDLQLVPDRFREMCRMNRENRTGSNPDPAINYRNIVLIMESATNRGYSADQLPNELISFYMQLMASTSVYEEIYSLEEVRFALPNITEWFEREFFPKCCKYLDVSQTSNESHFSSSHSLDARLCHF